MIKVEANQADTIIRPAYPVKFNYKRTWPKWELKFENYLSIILGVNGFLMSYVVRAQTAPDHSTDFQGDFISENIACTPLSGAQFQADTRKVHKILNNYLVAETYEQCVSSI